MTCKCTSPFKHLLTLWYSLWSETHSIDCIHVCNISLQLPHQGRQSASGVVSPQCFLLYGVWPVVGPYHPSFLLASSLWLTECYEGCAFQTKYLHLSCYFATRLHYTCHLWLYVVCCQSDTTNNWHNDGLSIIRTCDYQLFVMPSSSRQLTLTTIVSHLHVKLS